jgi:hypothetical protein
MSTIYKQPSLVDVPQFTNLEEEVFQWSNFFWEWVSYQFDKKNQLITIQVSMWRTDPSKNFTKSFIFDCQSITDETEILNYLFQTVTFSGSIII